MLTRFTIFPNISLNMLVSSVRVIIRSFGIRTRFCSIPVVELLKNRFILIQFLNIYFFHSTFITYLYILDTFNSWSLTSKKISFLIVTIISRHWMTCLSTSSLSRMLLCSPHQLVVFMFTSPYWTFLLPYETCNNNLCNHQLLLLKTTSPA